jgi:hypothetical protein
LLLSNLFIYLFEFKKRKPHYADDDVDPDVSYFDDDSDLKQIVKNLSCPRKLHGAQELASMTFALTGMKIQKVNDLNRKNSTI